MVDRVYKADLPRMRSALEKLRDDFSKLGQTRMAWTKSRIEILLKHVRSLEASLYSEDFSSDFSQLRKGVELFHSDLAYLRTNVKGLNKLLQSEKRSAKGGVTNPRHSN